MELLLGLKACRKIVIQNKSSVYWWLASPPDWKIHLQQHWMCHKDEESNRQVRMRWCTHRFSTVRFTDSRSYHQSWNVPVACKRFHNLKSGRFKAECVSSYSSKQSRFPTLMPKSSSCKWANRRVVQAAPWTHNKSPPEHFEPYFRDPRPVLSASAWRNAATQLNDPVKLAQT